MSFEEFWKEKMFTGFPGFVGKMNSPSDVAAYVFEDMIGNLNITFEALEYYKKENDNLRGKLAKLERGK